MQAPGAGVVAEALPEQQQPLLIGGGQGSEVREGLHPAPPIGEHHRQLGLLQHHLGHEHAIGIERLAALRPAAGCSGHPGFLFEAASAVQLPPDQKGRLQGRGHCRGINKDLIPRKAVQGSG